MPKLKTKKSAVKRFKKTGKFDLRHRSSNRSHINTKMTTKHKRRLRGMSKVSKFDKSSLVRQLPYI